MTDHTATRAVTDQTARIKAALRSASEEIHSERPHVAFLFSILRTYVLDDVSGMSERMFWDDEAKDSDIRRDLRCLFRAVLSETSPLLVARAQYSHALDALRRHQYTPGFTRADRKALRLAPLPFRTELAKQFARHLPGAESKHFIFLGHRPRPPHQESRNSGE